MEAYTTVKEFAQSYFEDRHSKFFGFCSPVSTEADAIDFIASVKKKYPDARHWVYAYVLRENNTMRYTDDREPQGTAGMPVLDAIRKNGCTDTVIVVVRYFGGVLLGTGGLVHAYSETALSALFAAKMITYSMYSALSLSLSYSDYQKMLPVFEEFSFKQESVDYSDTVSVRGSLSLERLKDFSDKAEETTSGRITIEHIGDSYGFCEEL